ncbi:MAG: preprotein translocase subunit YajC [Candidatus Poribacteria bacterium]|nr:preprotein translocase subunit YajC [Candidatus Poribacteria bacterium]MDE0503669.1 preprotein translocase subunit YajC [Candidatus Poribacteria bacterium]
MDSITGVLFMLVPMFVIFYFLLWRPEQIKRKKHQAMLENLTKADEVVTNGGLHGKIVGVDKDLAVISIAEVGDQSVKVEVSKSAIAFVKKGGELIEGE